MRMEAYSEFTVRCRGITVHDGKLLVVRHAHDTSFAALPGGHLEWGEDILTCMHREIVEELGVVPTIGRLLYVNTFQAERGGKSVQPIEFFFEITNGADFLTYADGERSHAHELAEVAWVAPSDDVPLLPKEVMADFSQGILGAVAPRYINGIKS
jgi:ADP-ribose pyrophosphatase YjhB (NUDIX family)